MAWGLALAAMAGQSLQAAAPATPEGVVRAKAFLGIAGTAIGDLTGNVKFPNSPDGVYYYPYFEFNAAPNGSGGYDIATPANNAFADNYGVQMQGYFYPPATGDYTFFFSADDNANLYLSTDEDPANKKLIAQESGWSNARSWDAVGSGTLEFKNSSTFTATTWPTLGAGGGAKITLTKGKAYYIEALMKEGGGGDNLAVAVADPSGLIDPTMPIPGQYLSSYGSPAAAAILSQPVSIARLAGATASFSVGLDIPPTVTLNGIQWTKNGNNIPGATSSSISFVVAAADHNAKIQAKVTTSAGVLTSSEATLSVATITSEFVAGIVKFEAYTGIGGTAVDGLFADPKYPDSPDDTRLLSALDTPNGYGDNYGARVSGFLIPPQSGDYNFFLSSDDASQLYISTDDKPENAQLVAEETGCCAAFMEPETGDPATTAAPISMTGGKKYAFYAIVKEGGGGDYLRVAVRKTTDTTPAASLQPISGTWIGANAKPSLGTPEVTVQPTGPSQTIQGTPISLTVDGVVTPAAFGFPLSVQWQKDGGNIPGATAKTYEIAKAGLGDSGTYRAVLSAPSGSTVNSADVVIKVVADTFAPKITKVKASSVQNMIVSFDEPLDKASAETVANYKLSGNVTVTSATLSGNSVLLVTSGLTVKQSYTLTVGGVKDLFNNALAAGTTYNFTANVITYADVILADKPLAFYRFEETTGQTTKNYGTAGAAADGRYMQGSGEADSVPTDAAVAAGPRPGEFLGFDPANKAVEMKGQETMLWVDTQQQMLNGLKAFSLEYWVKPANRKSDPAAFGNRIGLVGQNDAVEYGFINPNTIQIWTAGGGALDTSYSFADNEWHHIATIADGKTIKNYFDGKLVGTGGATTANYGSSTYNVHIGGGGVYDATGNFFTGQFDEVAIFDKAIPAERIVAHYKAGKEGGEADEGGGVKSLKIAWVSFHPADGTPATDAATAGLTEAADVRYTRLLSNTGHQVTRFVTTGNPDLATLNTFDLVIISRSVPSGDYQDPPETLAWNNGLTKPAMLLGGYILRNSRLGFMTGANIPDTAGPIKLSVKDVAHPIFSGIALAADGTTANEYAGIVSFNDVAQRGISVVTDAVAGGGKVLATVAAAGDPANNGTIIAEWNAGATMANAAGDKLGGPRLVFLTGSREQGITSQAAGLYDLTDDGAAMFLNAVKYMGSLVSTVAPRITGIAHGADGKITITWTGGGTLQAAPSPTGPWTDVAGATSPYSFTPTAAALFGRIKL